MAADVLDRLADAHLEVGCRAFGDGSMTDYLCDLADEIKILRSAKRQFEAEIARLRAALAAAQDGPPEWQQVIEDAGHYVAVCPPPPELGGPARIEMLERRERIGKAAATLRETPCPSCGGSGFSGHGTGYGDVCSECGGQRYLPPATRALRPTEPAESDANLPTAEDVRGIIPLSTSEPADAPNVLLTGVHPYGKPLRDK